MPQFAKPNTAAPTFGSISETGAKPGQRVVCCSIRDAADEGVRYVVGRIYTVVDHIGRPCVQGNSHGKKCGAGDQKWLIPFAGFGAQWQIVDE